MLRTRDDVEKVKREITELCTCDALVERFI